MTESYEPYTNAIAERINGILKQEFLLEQYNFPLEIMKILIKDVITGIYNSQRYYYSCGYLTPEEVHKKAEKKADPIKNL